MARYFGTNGVRGKFDELTPDLALRLSMAIGAYFNSGAKAGKNKARVIVARDCRLTGDILRSAVAAGLASVGCDVIDLGITSSPTAEFMVKKLKADGCIIITASHNPPEWNALKVVDGNGIALSHERGEGIEKLLDKPKLAAYDKVGRITPYETATTSHIEEIADHVDAGRIIKRKPKIIVDCGNGTAALIAPRLLKELGCEILSLNSHMDGRFPGRPSEPSEANVKELISLVKSSNADAGIAWDCDGDRVIFVDEKGNYIIGDKVYALSILWKAAGMKERGAKPKGDVVTTVATSKAVEDVAAKLGLKTKYTAIGAPYLSEEVAKGGAFMGGEEVGGVIWPESSLAKDGFLTAARLAEALCEKPLSAWLREVPKYFNVKMKLGADAKAKKEIVSRVLAHAKNKKLAYITVDGVRINFKDSWVIVRASGTEDYVRIFAEAKSEAEAKKLAAEYERIAKG
ncbi:MAG: phosphoglucosamine mutase [Candidatus Micrarchaeota archaeon]